MSLRSPRRLLYFFSALSVLAMGGFLAGETWQSYRAKLNEVHRTLESQTVLLAEHAQLTFATAGRLLDDITWEKNQETTATYLASHTLFQRIMSTPQFTALIVTDAHGLPVFTARKLPLDPETLIPLSALQAHRLGATEIVGRPLPAGGDPHRVIPVSRRLNDKRGEFVGMAMVLLDASYFREFYRSAITDPARRIGMIHRNGAVLSLYPYPPAELPTSDEGLAALLATKPNDTLRLASPLDGADRLAAYRNLAQWPLAVTVSYGYDAFMASLLPMFVRNSGLYLIFIGGTMLWAVLLNRSMREAYQARGAHNEVLREQAATMQLCQAIASHLPNGRVFVVDRDYRYVFVEGHLPEANPELQPQAMLNQHVRDIYPTETAEALMALIASALDGQEAEQEVTFRGRVFRTFGTALPGEDGETHRCLLLSQDITQFKQDQALLVTLNAELHRQASTDGLLGIANRREFDRMLAHEWQRGQREQQRLSLLLVDVDYFKRYNDTYGHGQGDACLQEVAHAISGVLLRSSDLAARYGGEELVVLLPNTDLKGALHVAERIHAGLARVALPFADSPVAGHVTVSIGVASRVPNEDSSAETLIATADEALYAAKAAGRNRTQSMLDIVDSP